jgi:hypothetical protein
VRARLTILFLVAFVALDIVLVSMSLRHASSVDPAPAPSVAPSRTSNPSASGAPGTTSAPEESGSPGADPSAANDGPSYLDLSSDGVILKATRGDCDTSQAPVVSVSTKAGKTFRDRPVDGLTEVLRVQVDTDGSLQVVGRTDECEVAQWTSQDAGKAWSRSDAAPAAWFLAPSPTQRAVFAPEGRRRTPCVPTSLSTIGVDVVRLLCDDGQVLGTSDGGSTWVTLGRLEGAVSVRFTTPGDGVALAVQDGCRAAVMETADGGTTWRRQACLAGDQPRAVGSSGDLVVAQVGDTVDVSTDGGETWPGATG